MRRISAMIQEFNFDYVLQIKCPAFLEKLRWRSTKNTFCSSLLQALFVHSSCQIKYLHYLFELKLFISVTLHWVLFLATTLRWNHSAGENFQRTLNLRNRQDFLLVAIYSQT